MIGVFTPYNKKKRCLKGFAFIVFKSKQAYSSVLSQEEHLLRGKMMVAREALRQNDAKSISKKLQKQKLFVKGLPLDAKEEEIIAVFERFGSVNRVLMCYDKSTEFRGFAYVVMETKSGFEMAIEVSISRKGIEFRRNCKIFVSSSKSREEMKKIHEGNENNEVPIKKNKVIKKLQEEVRDFEKIRNSRRGSGIQSADRNEENQKIEKEKKKRKILHSSKIPGFIFKTSLPQICHRKENINSRTFLSENCSKEHSLFFKSSNLDEHNLEIMRENFFDGKEAWIRFNNPNLRLYSYKTRPFQSHLEQFDSSYNHF